MVRSKNGKMVTSLADFQSLQMKDATDTVQDTKVLGGLLNEVEERDEDVLDIINLIEDGIENGSNKRQKIVDDNYIWLKY
ncbi:hypothetical protein EON65_48250, partial [archaeon]